MFERSTNVGDEIELGWKEWAMDFSIPLDSSLELGGFQELLNSKLIFQVAMKVY